MVKLVKQLIHQNLNLKQQKNNFLIQRQKKLPVQIETQIRERIKLTHEHIE